MGLSTSARSRVPDIGVDTPLSDAAYVEDGKFEDSRTDRGQIDGLPEDGESFFPIV